MFLSVVNEKWEIKILHELNVTNIGSCWLTKTSSAVAGKCERRTESETIAAKDQALQTKYLETQIIRKNHRANVEQRQGFDDKIQHKKAQPTLKIELFIRTQMGCELTTK